LDRLEAAFYSSMKWQLLSIVLGVILLFIVTDQERRIMIPFQIALCMVYLGGALVKWNRTNIQTRTEA
jgi:DMSO reductase anchor subunit